MATLTEQFNNLSTADQSMAAKLQEVLDALPAKLSTMKQESPDKSILLTLIPVEDFSPQSRDIFFEFNQRVAALSQCPDVQFTGKMSIYGNFLSACIITDRKNMFTQLAEKGRAVTSWEEYYSAIEEKFGKDAIYNLVREKDALDMTGHSYTLALTKNIDPNTLPPATYINNGGQSFMFPTEGKILYWQVNDAWDKPVENKQPLPPLPPRR